VLWLIGIYAASVTALALFAFLLRWIVRITNTGW
jgi:hypothetical protein